MQGLSAMKRRAKTLSLNSEEFEITSLVRIDLGVDPLEQFLSLHSNWVEEGRRVVVPEPIPNLKLNSQILQESIIDLINRNPSAGWKAYMSPRFSNYTVGQFKHLLGVKPTPQQDLKDVPVIAHPKTLKLPDHFDARTAWPHCSTIGKILGWLLAWS
ncbi:hypothetical protein RHSIM_Rhsim01G0001600 [Rhododendron simsii]|uniref:Peptidase C1A propeptide domain-containing protein n=1 Tax=Rhododendron simsii TaxID=118357 RepID=A0A834LXS9_RHOSS|nr:hypothetical protein RHSIM_Rhsim01G0001600 [Rhododendron simsii]